MPFGIIGGTGPGMRQVVGFGNQSTGKGTFGGKVGAHHCNQWGLYGLRVRQRRDGKLLRANLLLLLSVLSLLSVLIWKRVPDGWCSDRECPTAECAALIA